MDLDIIFGKINSVQRCLATIHNATQEDIHSLDNIIIQDAVVLNIQRAIQICIDMASALIADFKWGLPTTLRECFFILRDHNVLSAPLTDNMAKMVGFRNIAIHEYQKLDIHILKAIVKNHLSDFEDFYTQVLNYLNDSSSKPVL